MPQIPVEVDVKLDPAGRPAVLLQLPNGYVLMQPAGAREVAEAILQAADVIEHS